MIQVIGDGAQVQQSDVTGFFANTAFDGDADWTSVMNSHSITFQVYFEIKSHAGGLSL